MDDDEVQMDELWVDAGARVSNHAHGATDAPPQPPQPPQLSHPLQSLQMLQPPLPSPAQAMCV